MPRFLITTAALWSAFSVCRRSLAKIVWQTVLLAPGILRGKRWECDSKDGETLRRRPRNGRYPLDRLLAFA